MREDDDTPEDEEDEDEIHIGGLLGGAVVISIFFVLCGLVGLAYKFMLWCWQ